MNIKDLIVNLTVKLTNVSDSARLDIEILLCYVLEKSKTFLRAYQEYELSDIEITAFNKLFERRAKGEPVAYIIESASFWSLDFMVNKYTLIPRADTEILVESILNLDFSATENTINFIDMGTGSGAIAISLALEFERSTALAVDVSSKAIAVAVANSKHHNVKTIEFKVSNWFDNVDDSYKNNCDFIVSNPPYIDVNDENTCGLVKLYEPASALFSKNNGLADIHKIIESSKDYLRNKGYLALEHGFTQALSVSESFKNNNYQNIITIKDLSGNDRVTIGQYFK